jgi:hypothetical protein
MLRVRVRLSGVGAVGGREDMSGVVIEELGLTFAVNVADGIVVPQVELSINTL